MSFLSTLQSGANTALLFWRKATELEDEGLLRRGLKRGRELLDMSADFRKTDKALGRVETDYALSEFAQRC